MKFWAKQIRYISTTNAARMLGVDSSTVLRMIKRRELKAVKRGRVSMVCYLSLTSHMESKGINQLSIQRGKSRITSNPF